MAGISWTCPHCNRPTTITPEDQDNGSCDVTTKNVGGPQRFTIVSIACPNPECNKLAVKVLHRKIASDAFGRWVTQEELKEWRLLPISSAKVLPGYIPDPLVSDYQEACLISQYSPKASATLARRCLQGLIRDFFQVSKARLIDEIEAIKDKVDPLTWQAIDAVRSIGNIGAHMGKDINLIVDVDGDEAEQLIRLIELLIDEWYVQRHTREQQLKLVLQIKAAKEIAKKNTVEVADQQ